MLYLFNNIIDKDIFDALLDYKKNPDTAISKLANFAIKNNVDGNIIKKYLIYVLIFNENSFSLKVERNNKFNNDLSYAKVYYTYMGDEDMEAVKKNLEVAEPYLRTMLASKMKDLRKMPELRFYVDESIEYGNNIERILDDIKKDDE